MRANQIVMGTGVSIDIPGLTDVQFTQKVFARLQKIDKRFSTYNKNSEISRFRRGELREEELSSEVKMVMRECLEMEKLTGGYFSAWFDGEFDPTGYVKGWAIAEVSKIIEKNGYHTFCVGIGGDINAQSASNRIWGIGLQNPHNKNSIIGKIDAHNLAVATSGIYERGGHVINPRTGKPVRELLSITVVGPEIIKADVFATAAFVMGGVKGLEFIENEEGYEALAIDRGGGASATSGMARLLN
jgi:thiamine biosynthesis lipoprotein